VSAARKAEILEKVAASRAPTLRALKELGVPKSTYYRWRAMTRSPQHMVRRVPWNRLTEGERAKALTVARALPAWSSRQIATWITDNDDFAVSESSVFRILKSEGLVKRLEIPVPAGQEYHHKTRAPHQLWATDASYFRVAGWGYYYMVTVMDDFSRFILAWRLQVDMTSTSLIEVVQEAVDLTGMTDVPVEDRTRLLSDNGSGYVSRLFKEYLQLVSIRHILAAPYHPQTNGKLERYHQSLKRDVNQLPYDVPEDLEQAIGEFVDFYNYRRYHKALKDITPADMLAGRRDEILGRRREAKDRTIQRRRLSNNALREQLTPP
jgi:transposase InsO family protein|tara:strand:+ start:555 stop:1520 length:966 start_codon:yes stop_codon:yes gene_type:complete